MVLGVLAGNRSYSRGRAHPEGILGQEETTQEVAGTVSH